MIPIFFDTRQITDEFTMTREQVDSFLDIAIKEITISFARIWESEAKSKLKSTRQRYIQSLSVIDAGRLKGAIVLDYEDPVVRMVEEGVGAFDMKEGFKNSQKKKRKADGGWYLTIPFRVATPDALAESDVFAFKMDSETYEVAKELNPIDPQQRTVTQQQLPEQLRRARTTRPSVTNLQTSETYDKYVSKASPSAGITKVKDAVTGQSSYMKFRVVSDASDDNAFIHTGINAFNLEQSAMNGFESTIEYELNDAINVAFKKIGV